MGTGQHALGGRTQPSDGHVTFASLYDENIDEVYRFVHRRCLDHHLAEDLTHDTFLRAVRTASDASDLTIGWLLKVARNLLIDRIRRDDRFGEKLRLVGAAEHATDDIGAAIERDHLAAALRNLSLDHRLVLTLHYLDGLTTGTLAEELGRSPKAVEGLMSRARRNLRRELEDADG